MKLKELKWKLSNIDSFKSPKINLEQYITPSEIASHMIYLAHFIHNDIENKNVLDLCAGTGILGIAAAFFNPKELNFIECDCDAVEILSSNLKKFNFEFKLFSKIDDLSRNCDKLELDYLNYDNHNKRDKKIGFATNSDSFDNLIKDDNTQLILNKQLFSKDNNINLISFLENEQDIEAEEDFDVNVFNFDYELLKTYFIKNNIKFDTVLMNPPFGTRNKHEDIKALDFALLFSKTIYSLHKRSTRSYLLKKYPNSTVLAEISYEIPKTYKFHKRENMTIEVDFYRISSDI